MPNKWYFDPTDGTDGLDGTTWATAVKTVAGLQALALAAKDEIYVLSGTVPGGMYDFVTAVAHRNLRFIAVGTVVMDGEGQDHILANAFSTQWYGFEFKNSTSALIINADGGWPEFYDCTFYGDKAHYQVTGCYAGEASVYNFARMVGCTIWGLNMAERGGHSVAGYAPENCIWDKVINRSDDDLRGGASQSIIDYNATDSNIGKGGVTPRGTYGWDTATFPPPFVSIVSTAPDLRFNPLHAQYAKYMTGGRRGVRVGASGGGCTVRWTSTVDIAGEYSGSLAGTLRGAWANDPAYYDSGAQPGAEGVATAVKFTGTGNPMELDLTAVPTGNTGRGLSPALNMVRAQRPKSVCIGKTVDGDASVDNSPGGSATKKLEIRGGTDATFATGTGWTLAPVNADLSAVFTTDYVYWQVRALGRLGATGTVMQLNDVLLTFGTDVVIVSLVPCNVKSADNKIDVLSGTLSADTKTAEIVFAGPVRRIRVTCKGAGMKVSFINRRGEESEQFEMQADTVETFEYEARGFTIQNLVAGQNASYAVEGRWSQ